MQVDIVEFKARCADPAETFGRISQVGARHQGRDHQIDTYFDVADGRMKLRRGTIETTLIHYRRDDRSGPKDSQVTLHTPADGHSLLEVLRAGLDVLVVVDKHRDIFWCENVKLHVDQVTGLGGFLEVEAIDHDGTIGREQLQHQCLQWLDELGVGHDDLVSHSYSDLLLATSG